MADDLKAQREKKASTEAGPVIKPGIYQHYKGGHYYVFGQGVLHDTSWSWVAYSSTKATDEGRILFRSAADFVAPVQWPDGKTRPRFVREGWEE